MRVVTGVWAVVVVLGIVGCSDDKTAQTVCPVDQQCPLQSKESALRHPYEAWVIEWWRWSAAIPNSENPVKDPNGSKCAVKQPKRSSDFGSAWFLAGAGEGAPSPTKRACAIPDDRGLFFPVFTLYCASCKDGEDCEAQGKPAGCKGDPDTKEYLFGCLDGYIPDSITAIDATIDGKPVEGLLDSFRIKIAELFTMEGSPKAEDRPYICTYPARKAISDGLWIFVEPLSAGTHTLTFSVDTSIGFALDVRYTLEVQESEAFYKDHPELE